MKNIYQKIVEASEIVLVTLVEISGSAPSHLGAQMLVNANGLVEGTIGGGKLENFAITKAQELLLTKESFYFGSWNLQQDIKMSCGGKVSLSFQMIRSEPLKSVGVFGAGHVSQELVPLLLKAGFKVYVHDERVEWTNKFTPNMHLHIFNDKNLDLIFSRLDQDASIVSITKGHDSDLPVLKKALDKNYRYIGVMGSEVKANKIKSELVEFGFKKEIVEKIHSPIGIDINSNHPFHIAISIVSEILILK